MFYSNNTHNKDYFDKNFRNQKQPSTKGLPNPNEVASQINSGKGAFNKHTKRKRR